MATNINIRDNALDPGMSSGQPDPITLANNTNTEDKKDTITSADLSPVTPIVLPEPAVVDNSTVESNINNFKDETNADKAIADLKLKATEDSTGISDLIKDIGITSAKEGDFLETEGGYKAKKEYDAYTSQLESEQLSNRRRIEALQKSGMSAGAAAGETNRLNRESLSRQADIAILGNAAGRRYDTAVSIAKNKVEMLLAPKKAELEGLKYIQENNKQFQTAEFTALLNRKENAYNKELANKEKGEVMIVNALQGKAPQTLIDSARKILANGGTSTDVAAALGNYSLSSADRLDMKLKQAQIDKLYDDMNEVSATEKKEIAKLAEERKTKIPALKAKMDLITKVKNNPAFKYMVGTSSLSRDKGLFFTPDLGAVQERYKGNSQTFISAVNQLVNKEFLNAITDLKAQGGTLGALSEREGQKLSEAATQIGTWEIKDSSGKVVGYDTSETEFVAELDKIFAASQAVYEGLGGIIPGSPKEQETLDTYLNAVDKTLLNSDNLYSEAGYNQ